MAYNRTSQHVLYVTSVSNLVHDSIVIKVRFCIKIMKTITDIDSGYELNSLSKKLFNSAFIPLLCVLPAKSKEFVRKSHKSVEEVVDNATTHAALEVLYRNGDKHNVRSMFDKLFHRIWFSTNNSKAVRNRIHFVKKTLSRELNQLNKENTNIRILSIASGSARAVIESIDGIKFKQGCKLSVVFLDKNPEALKYSQKLLKDYNLDDSNDYSWINGTAGSFVRGCKKDQFDIIEMVGLLDYFNDEKAVEIFKDIRNTLSLGGYFITANINFNSEQRFVTRVVGWDMIYRTGEQLGELLLKAGFSQDEVQVYYEPLKLHSIAVVNKKQ